MKKGDYRQAEHVLRLASDMIPTRIRPKFYLWKLYGNMENAAAATAIAQDTFNACQNGKCLYNQRPK
jgi:hypothetical protein